MMITEGKKKKREGKRREGDVSARQHHPLWSRHRLDPITVLGKLEESGTAVSTMKGLLGLAWGERLKG